jgi:LPXTG-motif cell wall-anchored protein
MGENMRNILKSALTLFVLALFVSVRAYAAPPAPEVDPGVAVTGLALLAGSLVVLRSRRRK